MPRARGVRVSAAGDASAEDADEGELMPPLPALTSDSLRAAGLPLAPACAPAPAPAPAPTSIRYWDQRRFEAWIRAMPLVAKGPAPGLARAPHVHSRTPHAQMRTAVSKAMDATSNARLLSFPEVKFPGGRGDCRTAKLRKSGNQSKKQKSQSYSFRNLYKLACMPPGSKKIKEEHLKRMKDQGYDVQQKDSFIRSRSSSTLRIQCGPRPKVIKCHQEHDHTAQHLGENKINEERRSERNKGSEHHVCNLPGCPSAAIRVRSGKVPRLKKSGISKLKRKEKDKLPTKEVTKDDKKEKVNKSKRITKIVNSNEAIHERQLLKKPEKNVEQKECEIMEQKESIQTTMLTKMNSEDDEHCQGVKLPFLRNIKETGIKQVRRFFSTEKNKFITLPPLPKTAPGKPNSCTNPELLVKKTDIKKTESATGAICPTEGGDICKEDSKLANIILSSWINDERHKAIQEQ